jgi:hypothetical protein
VIDGRIRAHRLQHADAADAENDLLLNARFAISAVQAGRQLTIPRRVFFEVGVEQIQLHATDMDTPHVDEHRAIREWHRDDARFAFRRERVLDRRLGPIELLVGSPVASLRS